MTPTTYRKCPPSPLQRLRRRPSFQDGRPTHLDLIPSPSRSRSPASSTSSISISTPPESPKKLAKPHRPPPLPPSRNCSTYDASVVKVIGKTLAPLAPSRETSGEASKLDFPIASGLTASAAPGCRMEANTGEERCAAVEASMMSYGSVVGRVRSLRGVAIEMVDSAWPVVEGSRPLSSVYLSTRNVTGCAAILTVLVVAGSYQDMFRKTYL